MRIAFAAILPAVLLAAFAAPAAAEVKFGVINPIQMMASPPYKAAQAKLNAQAEKRESEVRSEGGKLDTDIERFRREADMMSPQQRTSTQNDLNTRRTNFEEKQRQYAAELQKQRAESSREFNAKVQRALGEVAREKGLDVILENPAFYNPSLDVTAEVLAKIATYGDQPAPPKADKKVEKKK